MHEDTVALLGACTAEIDRAVTAMDGLLPEIRDHSLRQRLHESKESHRALRDRACGLLAQYGAAPRPAAGQNLHLLKNNLRMALGGDDTTAALLVADGCDRQVRSLSRCCNRHCLADNDALLLTQALIRCEERLSASLRPYL